MRKKVIFITGASGEVGQALIKRLSADNGNQLLTFDLHPLPDDLNGLSTHIVGDILDTRTLTRIVSQYEIDAIYHLAALLSTRGEFTPDMAHRVNVDESDGGVENGARVIVKGNGVSLAPLKLHDNPRLFAGSFPERQMHFDALGCHQIGASGFVVEQSLNAQNSEALGQPFGDIVRVVVDEPTGLLERVECRNGPQIGT